MPRHPKRDPNDKSLTPRELEVARLLAVGKNGHEVGKALDISIKTVDTHRLHLMTKIGLRNNVELCLHAIRAGWIPSPTATA